MEIMTVLTHLGRESECFVSQENILGQVSLTNVFKQALTSVYRQTIRLSVIQKVKAVVGV